MRGMRFGIALVCLIACAGGVRAQTEADEVADEIAPIWPESKPQPRAETVAVRGDAVVGLDGAGEVAWTIRHASLGEAGAKPPPPPVRIGDRAIYAIRGDLIEVDVDDGVVARRTRFPASIDDVQLGKDGTSVDVRLRDAQRGGASVDVIHHELGKGAPGRATTDAVPWAASARDAGLLVPGWVPGKGLPAKIDDALRDVALPALAEAAERDPTNPHYLLLLGQLHDGDERAQAFTAAATLPGAVATDLLHVWAELEELGAVDAAATAFDRGLDALEQGGVRPDRQRALITLVGYVPRDAIASAVDGGNSDRVDALMTRVWKLAPHVEAGHFVWTQLAAWLEARGRVDLAQTWRDRAAEGGRLFGVTTLEDDLDTMALVSAALLVAIPLVALLIGLRRGAQARTTPAQFPYLQLVDLAAMLLPLIPAVYAQLRVMDTITVMGRSAAAPVALFSDAVDAETVTFVEKKLPESEAKAEVLTYLRAELDAMRAGGRSDLEPIDPDTTLVAAFRAKEPLGARLAHVDDGLDGLEGEQQVPTPSIPRALGLGLVMFAIGFAIAKRKPGAQLLARIVPGGAGPLWAFGGLVAGAFVCGLYYFAWDPWLGEVATPGFDKMFGLDALPDAPPASRPTPWWPFAAIGGAVAAQAAAAFLELRRGR